MKSMKYIFLAVALVIALGCAPQEQSGQEPQTDGQADAAVEMKNIEFVPQSVRVDVGDTVKWVNKESTLHTVTGFGVDTNVEAGASFTYTFAKAGTYNYECTVHPGMTGTVIVGEAGNKATEDNSDTGTQDTGSY